MSTNPYEWLDHKWDSVEDFLRSRVPDPDGSIQASREILEDLGRNCAARGFSDEQLKAFGLYSTRRTAERVEERLVPARAGRCPRWRRALGWVCHPNVVLTVAGFVALMLLANAVAR